MLSDITVDRPPRAIRAARRTTQLSMEGAYDVAARVAAREGSGHRIANLSIGEPSFATPEHIVEAGIRALRDGATRYTPVAGIGSLREAIAATLRLRGVDAAHADNVIVTPGAKPALFYALLALVEAGDEALVPDPGFPAYRSVAEFAGGVAVSYRTAAAADDVGEIAARITPRTRVLVLNAPGNPTGATFDAASLKQLADLAERHDLTVISDECYGRLIYDGSDFAPSIASIAGVADRTIVVDSFSKSYAMTGWRLGFALAPPRLTRPLLRLVVNGHSCTPGFVQRAGVAALTGSQGPLSRMRAELRGRRDVLVAALNDIPGVSCGSPDGAFYAFADVSRAASARGQSGQEFADWLLEHVGVAGVAGTAFGAHGEGHLRLSFAAPTEEIALAVERLRCALTPERSR